MLINELLAAGARDGQRCKEPLHIAEVIERLSTHAYEPGATNVRNAQEQHVWLMNLSDEAYYAHQEEQTRHWTDHHLKVLENLKTPDLLPWNEEEDRLYRERVWYPDMAYEAEGYYEPDWDDDPVPLPTFGYEPEVITPPYQASDDFDNELPF